MTGHTQFSCTTHLIVEYKQRKKRSAMYTFNLLPFDSTMNNYSNTGIDMPTKLNIEECSINELKTQISQILSLPNDSFGR
jgi:hypothetical protein